MRDAGSAHTKATLMVSLAVTRRGLVVARVGACAEFGRVWRGRQATLYVVGYVRALHLRLTWEQIVRIYRLTPEPRRPAKRKRRYRTMSQIGNLADVPISWANVRFWR